MTTIPETVNKSTYETVDGTEPSIDERHEPRTTRRDRQEGSYMMTEIGDGVFVQWSSCTRCKNNVEACTCPQGPEEPGYMHRWRINRFANSFAGRGVPPALPETLVDRDRRVNAVTRYLLELGYTITAPETKSNIPDFEESDYTDEGGVWAGDDDPDRTKDLAGELIAPPKDEVSEKVDVGMGNALETLRARAQEDKTDVGF